MNSRKKILMVATSRRTRGGITAVLKAHEQGEHWQKYHIRWIETHIDKGVLLKMAYFLCSLTQFFFLLPFYDLVHIHTSTYTSAYRKSFYIRLAKLYRRKIIVHLHCALPLVEFHKEGNRKLFYRIFRSCDVILVLSNQWKQYIEETVGIKDKARVLYNPVISTPSPDATEKGDKKNYILFAGTIHKQKGYQELLRAFKKIVSVHPEWKLVLAGNGEVEEGKRLAASLQISSAVVFAGWVSGEEKERLFAEASVFCLPSYTEGFPMAVLDAWAYGLPVVCTPVGGLPDVLEDGKNALLVAPGDMDGLATQLERIISDIPLREQIAEKSRLLAETVFGLQQIHKQLADLYAELLEK